MFVEFIIFSILVVLIEYNFFRKDKPVPANSATLSEKNLEEDVQAEKTRAFSSDNTDILKTQGLWYKYNQTINFSQVPFCIFDQV